jgi:hypothetical protein
VWLAQFADGLPLSSDAAVSTQTLFPITSIEKKTPNPTDWAFFFAATLRATRLQGASRILKVS